MIAVDGSTLKSCGFGVVELSVGTILPIIVEVLIVDEELLRFDFFARSQHNQTPWRNVFD